MKLITKIVGATLGLALAVGVGVGVANNNKVAKEAYAENPASPITLDWNNGTTQPTVNGSAFTTGGTTAAFATSYFALKSANAYVVNPGIWDAGTTFTSITVTVYGGENRNSAVADTMTVSLVSSTGALVGALTNSQTVKYASMSNGDAINNATVNPGGTCVTEYSFSGASLTSATTVRGIKINLDAKSSNYVLRRVVIDYEESSGGSEATITSISASLKAGTYYAGNKLSASDFEVTVNWSEGDPTYPTSGYTWTVNGEENGALALGSNNTIVVTYLENTSTINNVEAIRDPRWNTAFSITAVASIEVEPDVDTTEKYYVTAKITEITNTKYGNANAVDEDGTAFIVFGMYNFNGTASYENMIPDHKPVAGDIVVLYGVFTEYNSKPEIKNAWVVQRNGNVLKELATVLDLSTDTTSFKSEQMVTWGNPESDQITMLLDKGTSGTNANNYIGGNSTYTSTRFYNGQTLVVGYDATAIKMTRIIFTATTAGFATALAGSIFDNATAVANDKTVTVTVTNGTSTVTAHVGANCGFTKVQFIYEEASAQQQIECGIKTSSTIASYDYVKNGENNFTITNTKVKFGGYVTKSLWDELNAESTIQGYGVMISTADTDPVGYIGDNYFKTEYGEAISLTNGDVDAAIDLVCNGTKILNFAKSGTPYLHEAANEANYAEDTYGWNLVQKINTDHLTRTYVAIAYIRTNAGLVFLKEERISVQEIAGRMVASGDYDESPLLESLNYIADL